MARKWTDEQRKNFITTMKKKAAAKKTNGTGVGTLPEELEKALYEYYRKRIISELLRGA